MTSPVFNTTALNTASSRNQVLRNTYGLLALSLLPTIAGSWLGMQIHFARFFQSSPLMGFILFMVGSMVLLGSIERNKNSSTGVFLLLGFTFFMGMMLSSLLEHTLRFSNGGTLIALAGGGTALAFFALSAVASSTKRDLSGMAKFLTIGSVLLMAAIVVNIFLQIPALMLTVLFVLLGISCAFLVFDINRVVTGGETNYVTATLAIYIDLFNIFQSLLSILGIFGGDRD
jgi:modulator of FtsH protease